MKIFIIGHNNPDVDSIISSIVLKDYLEKTKMFDFVEAKKTAELNKETKFVLKYFKVKEPELVKNIKNKKVFLVDHSGYDESIFGVEQAEIVGVLDHHKLSGLKTLLPIFYRAEPLGATSSILAKMFLERKIILSKKQAGLLLAGILSDTLNLCSPTTTLEDKKIVKILTNISKENPQKLGKKILDIKSDIKDISTLELLQKDYKEFKSGKIKFGIGVCELLNTEKAKDRDFKPYLEKLKKQRKVDFIFFALIDIINNNTELFLLEKEKEIAEKVFKNKTQGSYLFLQGISSRKKQILPPLAKFLEKND
ncbi:MAG: manganese-dependent inorganic pyrophosphatase [Candidatus Pacebacteria bacterium]|nr:manganese-dependent inorganic pyrophosphatase [Candidatus Paceibacterota bacterium]